MKVGDRISYFSYGSHPFHYDCGDIIAITEDGYEVYWAGDGRMVNSADFINKQCSIVKRPCRHSLPG